MSGRLKLPPERDFGFYQRRKHDKWRAVAPPDPALEAPVADSHAHIHMLPDPAWELARAAANGVDFICEITDPSEDGALPFNNLASWQASAAKMADLPTDAPSLPRIPFAEKNSLENASEKQEDSLLSRDCDPKKQDNGSNSFQRTEFLAQSGQNPASSGESGALCASPAIVVKMAAGVHPHNAKLFTPEVEAELIARLDDPRVAALGEIGLDYHYDLSPRETQHDVFRRQIKIAQQHNLPIALHLRGGEDPQADDAHAEAFAILREENALGPRTLLHCCALPPDELRPWIDADCFIAYGGALTFKSSDAAREGARLVPANRLMLETDTPYMAPEPMRGAACTPAHVIFTAAALADIRGIAPGEPRRALLQQIHDNTLHFYQATAG